MPAPHTLLSVAAAPCALLGLAATGLAQAPVPFTIDQPMSAYSWSGTTSLGPLQGNPSSNFNLSGSQLLLLDGDSGQAITTGQVLSGGVASVVGNLSGRIPNPVPFLPPLATITITNLSFELVTGTFPIDASGAFSTLADVTILSGIVDVDPLIGTPSQSNLAGSQGLGQAFAGTVVQAGTTITGTSSQNTQFMFSDPASGISATITIVGTLVARHTCVAPAVYCVATNNSSGSAASITAQGSVRLQDQALDFVTGGLPQQSLGYYIFSASQALTPGFGGGQGYLCLGGSIFRLSSFVRNSGTTGSVALALPFGGLPPGASLDIGESWNFQYWFRDSVGGTATSNTSNAVQIIFCP
jgi:opacity protein-like surface antigen